MEKRKHILIVDDDNIDIAILKKIFGEHYEISISHNGIEALKELRENGRGISAIILDVHMPVMDGFGFLRERAENDEWKDIPVIIITADDGIEDELKALDAGADDFITKPFDARIMTRRVSNLIQKYETDLIINENVSLRERAEVAEKVRRRVYFDALTGLYSRFAVFEEVKKLLKKYPDKNYLFVVINIERLKLINELFGILTGDEILKDIAGLIDIKFKSRGVYDRLESDHFVVCCEKEGFDPEKLVNDLVLTKELRGKSYTVTVNCGIYEIDDRELTMEQMNVRANMALHSINGSYLKKHSYYDDEMYRQLIWETDISNEMHEALQTEQFVIYLQPQYNHATGEIVGAEALVRWIHPQRGVIPPGRFISVFEKNGFISLLDEYIWNNAAALISKWIKEGTQAVPISVNISRVDAENPELPEIIIGIADKYNIPHKYLRLEITETAYMTSPQRFIESIRKLRESGFEIEIDDFGSGYSSLNTLKDVSVDVLKLDMKFLSGTENSSRGGNILSSVIRMANWLDLPVIAEGVETAAQADYLKEIGCPFIQGYFYAKPMPVKEFEELVKTSRIGGREKKGGIKSLVKSGEFWNPDAQTAIIFNSFVGAAAVIEIYNGRMEILRTNDKLFDELVCERMNLVKLSDLVMHNLSDDDRSLFLKTAKDAIDSDETECEVCWNNQNTNHIEWLRVRMKMIARAENRIMYYLAVENVTKSKIMLEALKSTSTRMQAIVSGVNTGIAIVSMNGNAKIIYANNKFYSLAGYTREQFDAEVPGVLSIFNTSDAKYFLDEAFNKELKYGDAVSRECRIIKRDGTTVAWLLVHMTVISYDGQNSHACLLSISDVSDVNRAERGQKLASDKMMLLMEHTNAILFDYDVAKDVLTSDVSQNDGTIKEDIIENYKSNMNRRCVVHKDSLPTVRKHLRAMVKSPVSGTFDFLGNILGSGYCWNRVKYTGYPDDSGKVCRVVGRVDSVQEEYDAINEMKKREKKLIKLAEYDGVTGLLNRTATEKRINAALLLEKLSSNSVMVMIDVDNFKKINDTLGHLKGDALLRRLTASIKSHCRPTDIAGRVGGDEFIVLYRGINDICVITERLKKIEREINALAGEFGLEQTSVSFGIAKLMPRIENFNSAFAKADKALYKAKALGKNCYCLYDDGQTNI